jgi:hypothetical protein
VASREKLLAAVLEQPPHVSVAPVPPAHDLSWHLQSHAAESLLRRRASRD